VIICVGEFGKRGYFLTFVHPKGEELLETVVLRKKGEYRNSAGVFGMK